MKFDSTDHTIDNEWGSYYGAVRAELGENGDGNSTETVLEFEVPMGFAQTMQVTVRTGSMPSEEKVYNIEGVHTVRMKIIGEWEGGEIMQALAELVHQRNLRSLLLK